MTPKQAAFVSEYMIDHNATQAAIRAGYSKRTARQQAVELLANADVQQAIQAAELSAQQRNAITVDDLLSELEDARQLAKGEGQASAMVSATMSKAKMLGFDKPQAATGQQQGGTIQVVFDEPVTRIRLVAPDLDEHFLSCLRGSELSCPRRGLKRNPKFFTRRIFSAFERIKKRRLERHASTAQAVAELAKQVAVHRVMTV